MLKQFTIDFQDLGRNEAVRLWLPFVLPEIKYKYDKLHNYLFLCESGGRPKGGISNADDGETISLGGEQIAQNGSVNLSKIPYVSDEFYDKSKNGKVKDGDILICKDGALTGKTCLVDYSIFPSEKVMVNEHVYILRGDKKINQKFLFYLTRNNLFQSQVKDLAYKKKAQPGLNYDHLKKIKIPSVPKTIQNQIMAQIESIEKSIKNLSGRIAPVQEVINKIFEKKFDFNLKKICETDGNKKLYVNLFQLNFENSNLRFSYEWNQLEKIQSELYKNNKSIKLLGKFIKTTKNGWSPECNGDEGEQVILGLNSIQKNGNITFDNPKYTKQVRNNGQNFIIQDGDFFVSRGNTLDLVALASVAKVDDEKRNFMYPDLMIKIKFNENRINKEYMAFLFNSIIGRIYFKYSAKGKNQTMVKISSKELYDFKLPIPGIKAQQKIADEIKSKLDRQEKMKQKIVAERNKIDKIIEEAIAK